MEIDHIDRNKLSPPTLHVAIIGHVDHGKSTLAGRLLYETGYVSEEKIKDYREQSALMDKRTFEFAWIMDTVIQERFRGLTIEPSFEQLEIGPKRIVLVDGPGHYKYTKNAIQAIAEADVAVLVIAADDGIMTQTREHVVLAYSFGIREIVVIINKMDKTDPPFSQERFEELEMESLDLLTDSGFDRKNIIVLPAAAYFGDNLTSISAKLSWFSGGTVLNAIDQFSLIDIDIETPFRMAVDKVFPKRGIGQIALGRISSGRVSRGSLLVSVPGNHRVKVRSIEIFRRPVTEALSGDDVGIALGGIDPQSVGRGSMLGNIENPPTIAKTILAHITVQDDERGLFIGRAPILFVHGAYSVANVRGLVSRIDSKTGNVIERKPHILGSGESGIIELELSHPLAIETKNSVVRLARFILREHDRTVAVGICIDVLE